ncbi:amino acid adenylation domain-containing protein [Calothrix sp. PCC 7507]|uniref:non-ribosomal peptide synthetase family protein n=1 Tax=Calothrix sp. PCC 7507 TaxID=99598 RepID=UPI00029F3D12|nr:amino acid adenylation domain-containing protein [Calothrix sp. PCC 7507]AFY35840.1 amino acid adenylation domain protein [Calothrix sp. PCC 7507]
MIMNYQHLTIHELVENQVSLTPDKVAVIFQNQQLTYRQLNEKANQLAHYLQSLGVGSETLVGICVERSLSMLIGLLAILKAGGAYVPLDPSYPWDRLAFMLEDSQLTVLVTQQHLSDKLTPHSAKIVCLNSDGEAISPAGMASLTAQHSNQNPHSLVSADNLAYTIYTSGSTGKPKGVQIIHAAVVNFLLSMQQEPGLTTQDVLLAVTTISFDIAVLELFLPLIVGATTVMVSREVASDAFQLSKIINQSHATVMQATPATWRMLLAIGWQGNQHLKILCGGEALTRHLANQLLERSSAVWNMYGPTETTIWSTVHQVEPGDRAIPIGRPIFNTQIYIFKDPARRKNDTLKPVEEEEEGQLYIGGLGLARGYGNRPDLTSEKFIPDPFSNDPTARLYKTGDLARYLPDGNILIVGRIDHQVKIRGHRIELGEIEATLSQHPQVQECVVVAREDSPGDLRLVAYVVLKSPEKNLRPAQLKGWLQEKLSDYMVPAIVVFMDKLPLTPNCKVDRRALPVPTLDLMEEFVSPRTELEKQLSQIWTTILGVEVGVYQNFFESGGNSLTSALLIHRINETLKIELSLECLFKAPTIAELAEIIPASGSTAKFANHLEQMQADAVLEATIHPLTITQTEPQRIFLTGATGFIGAFLLQELLHLNPQVTVYCLVRANSLEAASERLRKSLESYEIWQDSFGSRIVPVLGDLSQPLLGLSEAQFRELADRIELIYHSGAYVNLVYPYTALRETNVLGTGEVLRLAVHTKTIPIHHISTLDVFQSSAYEQKKIILETEDILSGAGYFDGYSQSKWVAEKLVMAARDRGLPVCIYRLGMITGHSQTGVFQPSNLISRMIKGFIQMGYAPEWELNMNLTPVDYVAQAIAYLSRQPKSDGKTFHLLSPYVLSINQLAADLNSLGYPITSISFDQWQTKLLNMPPENALTPIASMFTKKVSNQQETFIETTALTSSQVFDSRNTQLGLASSDIICPPINSSVLKAYLSYFMRCGFLTKSTSVASGNLKMFG